MITEIIKGIEETFGAICTETGDLSRLEEIDLIAGMDRRDDVIKHLTQQGFIVGTGAPYKILAKKCIDGKIYRLDIALHIQYLAELFPTITFTDELHQAVKDDPDLLDFLQAIFLLRSTGKHLARIEDGFDTYKKYLVDTKYIQPVLFRKGVTRVRLQSMVQRNPFALIRNIYVRHWFGRYRRAIQRHVSLNRGKGVSIVGVDGSGKSTILKILSALPHTRVIYMGDGGFVFTKLYKKIQKVGVPGKYLAYGLQYIEVWFRYGYIMFLKYRGLQVFTDRYPGFNRHLVLQQKWYKPSNFLFTLIPKLDTVFFISAPSPVIRSRKKELTVKEIEVYQEAIRKKIDKLKQGIEIENIDIDATVNTILSHVR